MVRAESGAGQPDAASAAQAALARVLGMDASALRSDTPLTTLGWDSLARLCWADAMAELGWTCGVEADAATVGDLARQCVSHGPAA